MKPCRRRMEEGSLCGYIRTEDNVSNKNLAQRMKKQEKDDEKGEKELNGWLKKKIMVISIAVASSPAPAC